MIFGSTITGGGSNWYNADDAINVSNSFYGTLAISDSSKIYGGDALNESGGNLGIGGTAIYTHQTTGCTQITVTDSEIVGGAGFGSWDGSGIEVNKDVPMNSPTYKPYKVRANQYGMLFVKPYYGMQFKGAEGEYEILIPPYELETMRSLVELPVL